MKTKERKNRLFIMLLALIPIVANLSCSKDDEGPAASINAATQTFHLNGLNNCNTSTGNGSTLVMQIPYTSTEGAAISKLHIKTTVSDGGSADQTNTQFTDENSTITWAICFRFASQDWVEFGVQLEAVDGSVSNVSKVRVNKPSGAN